jgi:hypothetical protein
MIPMGHSIGVSGMGWRSQRASKRLLACVAVVGVGSLAGLVVALSADPAQTSGQAAELSPAEIVAIRFPGGASRLASNSIPAPSAPADAAPESAGYILASASPDDVASLMFNPLPTYSSAPQLVPARSTAAAAPADSSAAEASLPRPSPVRSGLPAQLATASLELPAEALAYADDPPARPDSPSPVPAKRAVQAPHPAASPGATSPTSPTNAVLNNAQLASIKERLKLTSYQSQLWPPVESALRDITWQGHPDAGRKVASNAASGPHGGSIDPNSPSVQRLKSAAFPLIMSLSDDQKQEVRTLVRLMGLENLAAQF